MAAQSKKQNRWVWKVRISGLLRAVIVAILVLIQFLFILYLSVWLREKTIYYYTLVTVASYLVILSLVNDSRSVSYKVSWITIVLLLPVSGHVMYVLWGQSSSYGKISSEIRRRVGYGYDFCEYSETTMSRYEELYRNQCRIAKYLESKHFPLYKNNQLSYYGMGEDAFEAIFEDLKQAKHYIFINFYIVAEGRLWERMHEILKDRLAQGVEIRFLYDDFGAMFRTSKYFRDELEEEGIQVRIFNPIHKYTSQLYMNYRSHQKLVIVDGEVAYTGGINLADEYANLIARFGVWKDSALRVRGEAAWGFAICFLQMWDATEPKTLFSDYLKYRPNAIFAENDTFCQVFTDGPAIRDNSAENVYHQMANTAQRLLYIATPYLIIDEKLRDALCFAARSGIDVRIITPGIPDKKMVKILTNYNYGSLLQSGVRIYEYTPGFLHSKIIMNEQSAVVGTINMDYRSFYLHYEDGAMVSDPAFLEAVAADFEKTFAESKEMTYADWLKRPLRWKIIQPLLNLGATLM